ncbi:Hypothetical protein A7982_00498 [Minicystis rosea]|nr:Hypothetical protein A7982_00498 [Minicystis rosea]
MARGLHFLLGQAVESLLQPAFEHVRPHLGVRRVVGGGAEILGDLLQLDRAHRRGHACTHSQPEDSAVDLLQREPGQDREGLVQLLGVARLHVELAHQRDPQCGPQRVSYPLVNLDVVRRRGGKEGPERLGEEGEGLEAQ